MPKAEAGPAAPDGFAEIPPGWLSVHGSAKP